MAPPAWKDCVSATLVLTEPVALELVMAPLPLA